jgi:proteasome lid subunit RPN8/RPN11
MVDAVVAHARRDHPDECCGVIAGQAGVATRVVPMTNAERSPTGFVFDPQEQLRVWRSLDDADEDLLVVYHSHTMTEAYPSRTDVRWSANTPGTSWLLVSTRSDQDEVRSFLIDDGVVAEEELVVVEDTA